MKYRTFLSKNVWIYRILVDKKLKFWTKLAFLKIEKNCVRANKIFVRAKIQKPNPFPHRKFFVRGTDRPKEKKYIPSKTFVREQSFDATPKGPRPNSVLEQGRRQIPLGNFFVLEQGRRQTPLRKFCSLLNFFGSLWKNLFSFGNLFPQIKNLIFGKLRASVLGCLLLLVTLYFWLYQFW